jgi:hypothetical protein
MAKYILEAVVKLVSRKIKRLNLLFLLGKQQVIRKKPHVIDVALEQSIQHNCWCITWMVIYIMLIYAT